ncbi:hypothetical protein PUN28_008922 [Cardiocondyla obscurior]|uniref:Mucin-5AC-like n=1 Tax=Cardiocondyla obscurior TaxID=286306 RepID=A0AAW2FR04_9HYME
MRMQLLKIVVVLLVAGSGDSRPQNGVDHTKTIENDAGWTGIQVSSKSHDIARDDSSKQVNNTHRDLKDLQYMDQSLRTVATQLLNVTNPDGVIKVNSNELIKAEHGASTTPKSLDKNTPPLIRDVSSEINLEPVGVSYGRPINSKFSYFEASHPGQAMAMTEEELEREMSTTRLITAYKNPTTTGGISTWILLNPPTTTAKSAEVEKMKTQQPFQTEVRLTVRPSSTAEKMETLPQPEKITEKSTSQLTPVITTEKVTVITKKPTSTTVKKTTTTTSKPEKITSDLGKTESSSTTLKVIRTTTTSTTTTSDGTATLTTVLTTKKSQPPRTSSKPKVTTPRTTSQSKPSTTKTTTAKPNQSQQTSKPTRPKPMRKTTVKSETAKKNETTASTGKIEKVTFKPVPIITTPQNKQENTERPMFVTKIKASVLMDTQKTTALPTTITTTLSDSTTFSSNLFNADLVEIPVKSKPNDTKPNNILKVQLKKPVDETTHIEIEPIKVNAPILKIEKVDKNKMDEIVMKDTDDLNNSKIDLKFDFNPELTRINVETQTEAATSTTDTPATTTKRPRHNSKRKKNKTRRRKPRPTSRPSTTVAMVPVETSESVNDSYVDNEIQESKIEPETKIATNSTKTKKKQPQKGISTQIYNFLSREVMPSFGVMSLVGLGLGLASYFLYPFGGTISRRNYDVEPNYKYNVDEYGGNYGQSEEEMLSKVFQGMTNNYENKYPAEKDSYNNNYYHYQNYDGPYNAQTTKKADSRYPSVSTSPIYKTAENTQSAVKYRNTDFRYPEAQTTPVYYDRKRPDQPAEVGTSSAANRQFVVGNVPKEYPFDVKVSNLPVENIKGVSHMSTEVGQTQFERDVAQGNFDFPNAAALHSYGHLAASTARPDDGYEEIEITPTAVAVEHGPRSLRIKRDVNEPEGRRSRSKRESVIQIIPSKRELEEEREEIEKEEDLSNEILDIIDSALPGGGKPHKRGSIDNNEVDDLEGHKRKEEAHTKIVTSKPFVEHMEDTTQIPVISTIVEKANDGGASDPSENSDKNITHPADSKTPEVTTVEWFDSSTTKPAEGFSLLNFVKKVAEIKFRLGLTILKHASEGFARYLGHVQKRINGEE